jgi:sulfite exporter TauE/SafE
MLSALMLGLALGASSALHCVAMCGPLVAFVALDPSGVTEPRRVVRYQLGRFVGYPVLGAAMGGLGAGLTAIVPTWSESLLSVALGLSLALAAYQLWPRSTPSPHLVVLGRSARAPNVRERAVQASAALLIRVRRAPFALGVLSALLPCGAIAAGALLAASTGHAVTGGLAMLGLAVASAIGVGTIGLALDRVDVLRSGALARVMAVTLALGAVVLCARPLMIDPETPTCCAAH